MRCACCGMVPDGVLPCQAIALMRQHGEAIFSQAIRDPVVVVGLPRSGTSAMVNLLAQHSKLGPLPMFQAFHPAGVPGELLPQAALANASHDPRIAIVDGYELWYKREHAWVTSCMLTCSP